MLSNKDYEIIKLALINSIEQYKHLENCAFSNNNSNIKREYEKERIGYEETLKNIELEQIG